MSASPMSPFPFPHFSSQSARQQQPPVQLMAAGKPQQQPMRRVSLPSALPPPPRSPRPRTPNSLSPKLGFLKEISEFDIDPPFISPTASSSSSADNSHCNSPMMLSPTQRPASARLYRRNLNPSNPRDSPGARRKATAKAAVFGRQPQPDTIWNNADDPDDGFRWTDVDGFYGRKNSIPLQQLLANDIALLNGISLKCNGDKLEVEQQTDSNGVNIPSDITEDEDEERPEAEGKQPGSRRGTADSSRRSPAPMSSPTKRRLLKLARIHSLENKKSPEEAEAEEEEQEEEEIGHSHRNGGQQQRGAEAGANRGKVQFMDSVDELMEMRHQRGIEEGENEEESERMGGLDKGRVAGADEEVRQLRRALKARRKQSRAQQLRQFRIGAGGQRVEDGGVRTFRAQLHPPAQVPVAANQPRNPKARRATCPEIWLSAAEDELRPVVSCAVRLFGCNGVGKKCVAKQLASTAEVGQQEQDDIVSTESEDLLRPYQTVSFLLNENEIHMEIIQGSLLPENRRGNSSPAGGELTIFAVVYSVDNRESFIRAAQILYRLYGDRREGVDRRGSTKQQKAMEKAIVPLILIANKSDLQRKRKVSSIEGKMLAKIYKCPFVEMSALLSANVDGLWRDVLKKLFKIHSARERLLHRQLQLHLQMDSADGSALDAVNCSPRLLARQQQLVGRIVARTRRFAKSCEDWIAAKIVPI